MFLQLGSSYLFTNTVSTGVDLKKGKPSTEFTAVKAQVYRQIRSEKKINLINKKIKVSPGH